jgi:sialidase-1
MVNGNVRFAVNGNEPETERFRSCRRMIIGPWVNQPDYYEGYNGFVGWAGISRKRSGRWFLTFTSGYWHFSPPLSRDILKNKESKDLFDTWQKIGMPYIAAPQGGRAHVIHSDDAGKTWSRPELLINTDEDNRHPTILELEDGTLLCTFFTGRLPHEFNSFYMRSENDGKTWSGPKPFPSRSVGGFGNGSALQLRNGRVLCCVGGDYDAVGTKPEVVNICASDDSGRSFFLLSQIFDSTGNEASAESNICELEDGRLILISRRKGPVCWSEDKGKTWSAPSLFGMDLYDPHFLLFPNGVLACFHGSYTGKGLRVILSKDNGVTWHGPKEGVGYAVDPTVYGYSHAMLLDDGSAYVTYLHTGGHASNDARTEAIWGLRVRPHDDACGIDILPAPGSPKDLGLNYSEMEGIDFCGGDPALGNLL